MGHHPSLREPQRQPLLSQLLLYGLLVFNAGALVPLVPLVASVGRVTQHLLKSATMLLCKQGI